MCGIAGGIHCPVAEERLAALLGHRGPDEFGSAEIGACRLYHTRLAIQDRLGGHQPMEREGCTVVFNGEIYNHKALRRELGAFDFRTESDTETLLALYLRYGKEMFERIDGMFAFAIVDRRSNRLFMAVDRAGKKPLYLYEERSRGRLFFASELGTIQRICRPEIDEEAIVAYLRSGFFPRDATPYRGVTRIENGSWVEIDLQTLEKTQKRYFSIEERYSHERCLSEEEAIEELEGALQRSVRSRLLSSDLEVGAFLSGGIDSSLVVAMASRHAPRLKTFTVAFEGSYDESRLAELTARHYGTDHHTLHLSMNLRDDLPKILGAYGAPFADSSAIPSWYVSRAAKEHVTVVLNGDGADELFGGYRRYVPVANGWIAWAKLLAPLRALLPSPNQKQSKYNYLYRLLEMSAKEGLDFYLSATSDIFEGVYEFAENEILQALRSRVEGCALEGLKKMLCLDFELLLFSDLLVKMDIATMAHSLEARSPFLGKEILDLAPTLPDRYKIRFATTKWILRKLAERHLPEEIVRQPKRGFEVPLKKWVETELKEPIADLLAPGCYSERFLPRSMIDDLLLGRGELSPEKRAKELWSLYALEVWKASL